jgi:hypothetical protein
VSEPLMTCRNGVDSGAPSRFPGKCFVSEILAGKRAASGSDQRAAGWSGSLRALIFSRGLVPFAVLSLARRSSLVVSLPTHQNGSRDPNK